VRRESHLRGFPPCVVDSDSAITSSSTNAPSRPAAAAAASAMRSRRDGRCA